VSSYPNILKIPQKSNILKIGEASVVSKANASDLQTDCGVEREVESLEDFQLLGIRIMQNACSMRLVYINKGCVT
jgi:hypothetical protein